MRVLHLVGSATSPFHADLSRLYAADCLQTLEGYEHHVAYVSPDGRWRFPEDLSLEAIEAAVPTEVGEAVERLGAIEADVALPQMFCLSGMTHYRALLDVLRIPYVGNAPDVMALTAHKARAKAVVAAAGVAVPRGEVVGRGGTTEVEPPAVVKPVDADNSLGVTLVRDRGGYDDALAAAFEHADEALVERYVELGREVRCGIVVVDGRLVGLPLEEYRLDEVRTQADKLVRAEDGELALVAKEHSRAWILAEDDPVVEPVRALARACHVALGCRDYSLFDVRVDREGRPWFLEASLYCSFARQSVLSVMAQAAGIATDELFATALAESRRRTTPRPARSTTWT